MPAGAEPHAPYSVHKWLLQQCAGITSSRTSPLAIHVAETRDEIQLLDTRSGPFVPFLQELGVWDDEGLAGSIHEIIECTQGTAPRLLVHCNYLDPAIDLHPETTIIYCPRTHAAFGHPPHPFSEFLARGVRVALGTDSLASNPDLDMLAEARFLHRYPDFPADALLRMVTLSGAEALGWADEAGSLTPGKSADLAVVPLDSEERDPYHLLLKSSHRVSRTLFRGKWVTPHSDFLAAT